MAVGLRTKQVMAVRPRSSHALAYVPPTRDSVFFTGAVVQGCTGSRTLSHRSLPTFILPWHRTLTTHSPPSHHSLRPRLSPLSPVFKPLSQPPYTTLSPPWEYAMGTAGTDRRTSGDLPLLAIEGWATNTAQRLLMVARCGNTLDARSSVNPPHITLQRHTSPLPLLDFLHRLQSGIRQGC